MFQSTIVTAFEFVCFSRLPGSHLVAVSSFLVLLRALQRYGSGSPAPVSAGTQDLAAKSARAGRRSTFGVVRPLSNSDEPLLLLPAVFPLTRWLWPAAFPAEVSHAAHSVSDRGSGLHGRWDCASYGGGSNARAQYSRLASPVLSWHGRPEHLRETSVRRQARLLPGGPSHVNCPLAQAGGLFLP